MRWLPMSMGILALLMAGCPSEFGKDGRVSKAIHKDTTDMVIKVCSEKRRQEVCGTGQENSRACLDCGGPQR